MATASQCENIERDARNLVVECLFQGIDFDSACKVLRMLWVEELRDRAERLEKRP